MFAIVRNHDRTHTRPAAPQCPSGADFASYRGLFDGLTQESLGALLAAGPGPTANHAQLVVNEPCCMGCGTPASSGACTCAEATCNEAPVGACSIEDGCGLFADDEAGFDLDAVTANEQAAALYWRLFGTGGAPDNDEPRSHACTANFEGTDPLPLPREVPAPPAVNVSEGQAQRTTNSAPSRRRVAYWGDSLPVPGEH